MVEQDVEAHLDIELWHPSRVYTNFLDSVRLRKAINLLLQILGDLNTFFDSGWIYFRGKG